MRLAREEDAPAIEMLIRISARVLQSSHYSEAQIEGAVGSVFDVDRQLISDGTYFVAEHEREIVGCGGWSKRKTLFGGDATKTGLDIELDPKRDSARIRAFFVHPVSARCGIGREILQRCEKAIQLAGFRSIELVATLAGLPFTQRAITRRTKDLRFHCQTVLRFRCADGQTVPIITSDLQIASSDGSTRRQLVSSQNA